MKIDIEKQKEFLSKLGTTDGKLNSLAVTIDNLYIEQDFLSNWRKEYLKSCQHIDEEGNIALSGGAMFVWCQICGKVLNEDEIKELEQELETPQQEE